MLGLIGPVGYGVGSWLEASKKAYSRQSTAVRTSRSCTGDMDNASTCARGVWSRVTLFIAYSFSCDSFDCVLCIN